MSVLQRGGGKLLHCRANFTFWCFVAAWTALTAQQRILEGVREICSTYAGKTILLVSHKHIPAMLSCALK
jgi:broad specificity phosphatase PhoE